MNSNLISDKVSKVLLAFTLPYLLSSFLQTFYGMADLFIVGQFNGADCLSAVSIGSQFMHFVTVIIIGLAMGTTIHLGHSIGAKEQEKVSKIISNTILFVLVLSIVTVIVLLFNTNNIITVMSTPTEAISQMKDYLFYCSLGIPFIVAYNVISSIFRGAGDSKSPMIFIAISCILNVILDFVFVGGFAMQAKGAAIATIISQAVSSVVGFYFLQKKDFGLPLQIKLSWDQSTISSMMKSGIPLALQDGLIQISFLVITIFANSRGLIDASAVGIVEKLISFFFLVPSAFLGSLSALVSINVGAKAYGRANEILKLALTICCVYSILIIIVCQINPEFFLQLFTKDADLIQSGVSYLKAYSFDTLFASMHFCFSGYFCGLGYSSISFIHNMTSVILVRIPGSYLACQMFKDTLFPMGCAAPLGSLLSVLICIGFMVYLRKKHSYLKTV